MIKAEHLVKRYGQAYALNDVSFEIGEGEIVGLLGPNGAGKSTTMNIMTGFLSASSGKVTIGDADILEDPIAAKKLIGFLPEQPPVYPDMTVTEYLRFVYDLKGCTLARDAHLAEILSVTRTSDVKDRLIRNLSKGYRQRVGIAGTLVGDPKIIILDEPTVGLDPKQIIEVRNLIRTLGKRHTVILSTHILSEVQSVCERVIVMNHGKIIADRPTDELSRALEEGGSLKATVAGPAGDVRTALSGIAGIRNVIPTGDRSGDASTFLLECERGADVRKPVFYLCAEKNWPLVGMADAGGDLESVFIRLVNKSDGIPEKTSGRRSGK